jgi:hypothetical protein
MAKIKRDYPLSQTPAPAPIQDSTLYYKRKGDKAAVEMARATTAPGLTEASNKIIQADKDMKRQKLKGKPGYDKMGFPIKKQ